MGRTPVVAETCDSHVCAHAVSEAGLRPFAVSKSSTGIRSPDPIAELRRNQLASLAASFAALSGLAKWYDPTARPAARAPERFVPIRGIGGERAGRGTNEREPLAGRRDLRPVDRPLVVAHVDAVEIEGCGRRSGSVWGSGSASGRGSASESVGRSASVSAPGASTWPLPLRARPGRRRRRTARESPRGVDAPRHVRRLRQARQTPASSPQPDFQRRAAVECSYAFEKSAVFGISAAESRSRSRSPAGR